MLRLILTIALQLCIVSTMCGAHVTDTIPGSFEGAGINMIDGAQHIATFVRRYNMAIRTVPRDSVRIIHIGDSHVRGRWFPMAVGEALGAMMTDKPRPVRGRRVRQPLFDAVDTHTAAPVVMDYVGINGAAAGRFIDNDAQQRIAAFHPDLIIISFGTNEAHARFDSLQHVATLRQLVATLQQHNPNAQLLLTTPPGSYLAGRTRRWKDRRGRWQSSRTYNENHRTEQVAACIADFAHHNNIALWNLFEIAGGKEHAQQNWWDAGLMQTDHIHYTQRGYTLMGHLLGEAIKSCTSRSAYYLEPAEPTTATPSSADTPTISNIP